MRRMRGSTSSDPTSSVQAEGRTERRLDDGGFHAMMGAVFAEGRGGRGSSEKHPMFG